MTADLSGIWKCRLCGRIGADMWPWNLHIAAHGWRILRRKAPR